MIQPSPLGHAAEFGESSAAATDVEKIEATKSAARTWIAKGGRIAFMALFPAAMMGTVEMPVPVRRDNHAARAAMVCCCSHHHRPARSGSPGATARVHGAQPIEAKPRSCKI